jgi:DNA processing protein
MDYRRYIIALREYGKVGPKGFQQLLLHLGSPDQVFNATLGQISSLPRFTIEKAKIILEARQRLPEIDRTIEELESNNIHILTILDENYPELLRQIDDPPPLLYYKGKFPLDASLPYIGIIGSTNATQDGIATAVALGKEVVSQGGVVVSGLAKGIDVAAHLGALANNGKTYAVIGSGLETIHPKENTSLAERISENGAVISEYSSKAPFSVGQLMARNRIVVGLSQAVILVEESIDSQGSSNAAQRTLDLGRPLFVSCHCPTAQLWKENGALVIDGNADFDLVFKYL